VVFDPNAMYGSAALRFTASAMITGAGTAAGAMAGAAVFAISASAVISVAEKTSARRGAASGYGRRGHHGGRWTPPAQRRNRHEREREAVLAIFGR